MWHVHQMVAFFEFYRTLEQDEVDTNRPSDSFPHIVCPKKLGMRYQLREEAGLSAGKYSILH